MNETAPFPSGFPLQKLPELTEEVFFAYHTKIDKLLYVNPAFERTWNISRTDATQDLSLLINSIHPDDREHVTNAFAMVQQEHRKQNIDFRIQPPDKELKWIRVDAYLSEDIIMGTATDISADKSYSDTLHKFSDKKNSVLTILSHDLIGPLGNIEMSSYLMKESETVKEDKEMLQLIDTINSNSKKSVAMIRDLLNAEFLQSSEAGLVKQRVDIVAKLTTIVKQIEAICRVSNQSISLITPLDSLFIIMDESKFMQVITNLISNAQKFTPDNGKIILSLEDQGKTVLIKVQDTGIGIPEDLQPYLFDKFTKARRRGIKGETSIGLGMNIIKTIVEWHNGRIWFSSIEGKGTTFFIEIPKES